MQKHINFGLFLEFYLFWMTKDKSKFHSYLIKEYYISTAPNGEQVPAKIVQQPDGDYKVEYASKYTGM